MLLAAMRCYGNDNSCAVFAMILDSKVYVFGNLLLVTGMSSSVKQLRVGTM